MCEVILICIVCDYTPYLSNFDLTFILSQIEKNKLIAIGLRGNQSVQAEAIASLNG